jgi:hypothetical protein
MPKKIDQLKKRFLCNPKIKFFAFNFPIGTPSILSLSDILEENVSEKYFLSKKTEEKILESLRRTQAKATDSTTQTELPLPRQAMRGGVGAKTGLYFVDLSTKASKLTDNARAIQARYNKGYSHHSGEVSGVIQLSELRHTGKLEIKDTAPTLTSQNKSGDTQPLAVMAVPLKFLDRNQKNYQGEYSFTVDTVNSGGVMIRQDLNKMVSYQYGKESKLDDGTLESKTKLRQKDGEMFDMQKKEENGNTPLKRELARQSDRKLSRDLPKLPYQTTQETTEMQSKELQPDTQEIRLLRETQPEVQEVGESIQIQREPAYQGYRIRRLTCRECERLMGLTDGWTRYGVKPDGTQYELSDSARYKLCGNGVVVNVVKAIINNLNQPPAT